MTAINKKIREFQFSRGWSDYELALKANIPLTTLTSFMKRNSDPKIETLQRICEAFGISLAQFFAEDEHVELLNAEEQELVTLFRNLPLAKRHALMEVLTN